MQIGKGRDSQIKTYDWTSDTHAHAHAHPPTIVLFTRCPKQPP